MPELPEVETTKTSLEPLLGQTMTAVQVFQPKLRWPVPNDLAKITGYQLSAIDRRAKYLLLTFTKKDAEPLKLIVHLGMSGSLQQYPDDFEKRTHDHLIFTFDAPVRASQNKDDQNNDNQNKEGQNQQTALHYHDPRRFGAVLWHHDYKDKLLNHLGVEPLAIDFDADYLYQTIQRSRPADNKTKKLRPITKPIKAVIMEQQVVVGVGNIYATESLFLANIHPLTPANTLSFEQIATLTDHIKAILQRAIDLGGSTLRDFTVASGQSGYFQQTFKVYGKQGKPCPNCGSNLDNVKITGRASVFCPSCQPLFITGAGSLDK